ncbi:MAG: SGNH/GDSL hydrolase family protein [Lachnospiraceae bacterium]|nr:SGNH/GDSL hydrolase family protein [Lachnospiraceae bacterium]
MEKSKSSGIIVSASAILAVILIVVSILLINQKRKLDEHREAVLKETINYNEAYETRLDSFYKFADKKLAEREKIIAVREADYDRYSFETYGMAHLSMWDISGLSTNQYEEFFGKNIQYAEYMYTTPMELKDYLKCIFSSENGIGHLYINIDPYILEKNYYDALIYEPEPVSFENYIHSEIFPILDANPDTRFEFFLPARPVSYWASIPISEYSEIIDKWYTFLMYLHWCPNAVVRYMGGEEWLVSNDLNYVSSERLKDDVMQKVYVYLYAYEQYEITPPELKQRKSTLDKYIRKYINGEYDICDLSDYKIVFMGDSLFDYIKMDSAAVPGVVKRMTGAECYNVSLGGTLASAIDRYGFTGIANAIAMKGTIDLESRSRNEALRFSQDYKDGDALLFVVLYGLNDYFSSVPISPDDIVTKDPESEGGSTTEYMDESTFLNSYEFGLESIRLAYPEAEILVVTPYGLEMTEELKKKDAETGKKLADYINAIEDICYKKGISCYDLYKDGPINKTNRSEYLVDGIHTNEKGAFLLGESIAGKIAEEVSD